MITENLSTLKIHKLSQAQYDRESKNGNLDETALYLTPEVKFNKVLCDSGNMQISVFIDGAVEIPEINNYSIFTVDIFDGVGTCTVLCTKTQMQYDGRCLITGLNCVGDMYYKFFGCITETGISDSKASFSNSTEFSENDWSSLGVVSKIVGVM